MTPSVTITILDTKGSVPRAAGTTMQVFADGQSGTIGGGALEWEATRLARRMLKTGRDADRRSFSLGPDMGQCCGGVVTLGFQRGAAPGPSLIRAPLVIWGAGHVGRAIAAAMAPLRDRPLTLVDTTPDRLPDPLPAGVTPLVAADMPRVIPHTPRTGDHLILTYSHEIDLALCNGLLRHGAARIGLIGSATKWARFRKRLTALGHAEREISRITCPIGDPSLGKHPQAIALGVATALLSPERPRTDRGQAQTAELGDTVS